MRCPKCAFEQPDGGVECLRCGVIFARIPLRREPASTEAQPATARSIPDAPASLQATLPPRVSPGLPFPASSERLPDPSSPPLPRVLAPFAPPAAPVPPPGSSPGALYGASSHTPSDLPPGLFPLASHQILDAARLEGAESLLRRQLRALFLPAGDANPVLVGGRALAFLLLIVWGWRFLRHPLDGDFIAESFMHLVNLPFHEAGHLIFSPFGRFSTILGGSLFQVLMPLICLGTLLIKTRDAFGAAVCLWWAGQSILDVTPYIDDARSLNLVLLGGVTGKETDGHDWNNLLGDLGWLQYDHRIANLAFDLGALWMCAAFVWGGTVLYRQVRSARF